MNDEISGNRRRRRARPLHAGILAVMAGTVLFLAACSSNASGSPSSQSTPTTGTSAHYQKALAYAQCIRTHGVPNFPDPNSQGQFTVQGNDTQAEEAALATAKTACRSLLPGGQLSQSQEQQRLNELLQFARCMRSHGVPNFPDPKSNPVSLNLRGSGIDRKSPQFQSAQQACSSVRPKAGGTTG